MALISNETMRSDNSLGAHVGDREKSRNRLALSIKGFTRNARPEKRGSSSWKYAK